MDGPLLSEEPAELDRSNIAMRSGTGIPHLVDCNWVWWVTDGSVCGIEYYVWGGGIFSFVVLYFAFL